jgi:hypothetical protein
MLATTYRPRQAMRFALTQQTKRQMGNVALRRLLQSARGEAQSAKRQSRGRRASGQKSEVGEQRAWGREQRAKRQTKWVVGNWITAFAVMTKRPRLKVLGMCSAEGVWVWETVL